MKYEKPEVVELSLAIDAIQSFKTGGGSDPNHDATAAYEDWE